MFQLFAIFTLFLSLVCTFSHAIPYPVSSESHQSDLHSRTANPYFPDQPPSCPICEQNYYNINSCAQSCVVLQNVSMIIFNPGAFISVIECACTDTFQSAYPQCVDCFEQTNQTALLNTTNVPAVVDGMRKICALESTLLGGVATADGEVTPTSSINVPSATASSRGTTSTPLPPFFAQIACALIFGGLGIGLLL